MNFRKLKSLLPSKLALYVGASIALGTIVIIAGTYTNDEMAKQAVSDYRNTFNSPRMQTGIRRDTYNLGYSGDAAQTLDADGNITTVTLPGQPTPSPQPPSKFDANTIQAVINDHCTAWESSVNDWKVTTINGAVYPVECQNSAWSKVKGASGSDMPTYGCMWYATAAALSASSGKLWAVEDIMRKLGYQITCTGGKWSVTPDLPCVGLNAGKHYVDGTAATPWDIINKMNAGVTAYSSNTIPLDDNWLQSGGIYIIHAKKATGTLAAGQAGEHWLCVVGQSADKYYLVNNGNRSTEMDKNYVNNHINWGIKVK